MKLPTQWGPTGELTPITTPGGQQAYRVEATGEIVSPGTSGAGGFIMYNPQTGDFDMSWTPPATGDWASFAQNLQGFNTDPANRAITNHSTDSYMDKYGPLAMSLVVPTAGVYTAAAGAAGAGASFMDTLKQVPGVVGDKFSSMGTSLSDFVSGGGNLDAFTAGSDVGDMISTIPEPAWETTVDPGMVRDVLGMPPIPSTVPEPAWESTVDPNAVKSITSGSLPGNTLKVGGGTLSKLLGLSGTAGSAADLLEKAAPGILGMIAANDRAGQFDDIVAADNARAERNFNIGAPSRARYEASFAPDFDLFSGGAYKDALDTATKSMANALSVQGNPFGNPTALAEIHKNTVGNVALPALNSYRTQNANTGGYSGFNTAPNTSLQTLAANAGSGIWDAAGATAADVFTPKRSLADLMKELKGNNIFSYGG